MVRHQYKRTHWEERVVDDRTGEVIVEGTPVDETNMNNIEEGILTGHYEVGLTALVAMQIADWNQKELEKYKNQRIVQGRETISNTISDNGYFRNSEPFKTVSLDGFPQINAPDYDVIVTPTSSDDMGAVGNLEVYDKTQNGFKVR